MRTSPAVAKAVCVLVGLVMVVGGLAGPFLRAP
jgi:hypothetical protein